MKLKEGDRVKFLNDTGQGVLVRITSEKMGEVLTEDGFVVPVLLSELIRTGAMEAGMKEEEPDTGPPPPAREHEKVAEEDMPAAMEEEDRYEDRQAGMEEKDPVVPEKIPASAFPPRLFFGVTADEQSRLSLYLVNDSPFYLYFTVFTRSTAANFLLESGQLEPDTRIRFWDAPHHELAAWEEVYGQALCFYPGAGLPRTSPLVFTWKTAGCREALGRAGENEYFERPALLIPLETGKKTNSMTLDELKEKLGEKQERIQTQSAQQRSERPEEVDLHIGMLVDDPAGLSAAEILEIQMARFTTALEGGLLGRTGKMVFIHGLGAGRLKHEIRRVIEKDFPRLKYQDASFREYGYGATLVIFPKK